MQDFSKRIGLVAPLNQVTGYSSSVNGKNKAKKKEQPWFHRCEEAFIAVKEPFIAVKRFSIAKVVARRSEEARHDEGYCFPWKRKKYKYQSQVCHGEEALRRGKEVHHNKGCCSPQRRENVCLYPSFKSNQTS